MSIAIAPKGMRDTDPTTDYALCLCELHMSTRLLRPHRRARNLKLKTRYTQDKLASRVFWITVPAAASATLKATRYMQRVFVCC